MELKSEIRGEGRKGGGGQEVVYLVKDGSMMLWMTWKRYCRMVAEQKTQQEMNAGISWRQPRPTSGCSDLKEEQREGMIMFLSLMLPFAHLSVLIIPNYSAFIIEQRCARGCLMLFHRLESTLRMHIRCGPWCCPCRLWTYCFLLCHSDNERSMRGGTMC